MQKVIDVFWNDDSNYENLYTKTFLTNIFRNFY